MADLFPRAAWRWLLRARLCCAKRTTAARSLWVPPFPFLAGLLRTQVVFST